MAPTRVLLVLLLAAALLAPAAGAATLVVAAADASAADRAAADIRCDGVDDQRDINNAFNSLPDDAGTVRLTAGTFNCSESIFPNGNSELIGAGQGATRLVVVNDQSPFKPISVTQPDVLLRGFTIMGSGAVLVKVSRVVVEEVTATSRGPDGRMYRAGGNGMFYIWADGQTIEDVAFIDCTAEDAHTHGFNLNAVNLPHETRNIRFVNCVARRCGFGLAGGSRSEWVTGFDIQENNDLYDVQVINCRAEDNWQSGFHFEPGEDKGTVKKAITFQGCTAERNGQRNPAAYPYTSTFISGFYVHFNAAVTDCASIDNKNAGFYVEGGDSVVFTRCTDRDSTYGWKIVKNARNIRLEDCASYGAHEWALWSAYAANITLVRFRQVDAGGGRGYQSMLGWYYDEPSYQLPVTGSRFEITASGGDPSLGIINQAGSGNTYLLTREGESTPQPTPEPTPGAPVAAFSLSPAQGRAPLNVSFADRSTGRPDEWSWEFGDGGSSTARNPYHVYTTDGLKTVTLTVGNEHGSNATTGYVTVGSAPFAAFSAEPRTVGAGRPVAFTDRSLGSPTGWSWTFGDGGSSTLRSPSHAYANSGLYTVRLIASYAGSSDTEQKTDYIRVVPDARFSANATRGKAPLAVAFTDRSNGTPTAWAWEFGDGASSTARNPAHVYARAGTFTVNLTARNGYGSTTLSRAGLVTVELPGPIATIPGGAALPRDLDDDGLYEDANGNGRIDFADVVLYFNQMNWIAAHEPVAAFDCNGNGRIDFADVVWLFNHL